MHGNRREFLVELGAAGMCRSGPRQRLRCGSDTVFEEVDARAIGVVAGDPNAAASNSSSINQFFATAGPGTRLVLPRGTIYALDTIELVNQLNVNNTLGLRGAGIGGTEIRKITDGDIVRVVGSFNYLGDMSLNGLGLSARAGVEVRATPQVGAEVPSKLNTFRNLRIVGCRVGVRVGHFSDLDGDAGDRMNPDIAGNLWQNIFLQGNRYGIVRDGQNILNDHFENLFSVECDRNHVLIPFGGDFRCFTAQFGRTLESDQFPKIHSNAGSPLLLVNARSENGNLPDPQPPFLKQENTTAHVDLREVVVTNQLSGSAKLDNLQIQLFGGAATLQSCEVSGKVHLIGARWSQITSDVGSFFLSSGAATLIGSRVAASATLVDSDWVQINSEAALAQVGTNRTSVLPPS